MMFSISSAAVSWKYKIIILAFLSMIVVLPEYQGHGCGSRLVTEVEHECVDDGMKILAVEVRTDNERAIRFYKERGFAVVNALSDIKVILEKDLA